VAPADDDHDAKRRAALAADLARIVTANALLAHSTGHHAVAELLAVTR